MRRVALMGRTREIAETVKAIVQSHLPDAEVVLYGSRARGNEMPDSDWDFLILTDALVTVELEEKIRRLMDDFSLEQAEVISAFLESRQQWLSPAARLSPYRQAVERDGIAV